MEKIKLQNLIILLPGITGSVLQKDNKDVWAISGISFWQFLTSYGKSIKNLALDDDSEIVDDLGDGITATRLVDDFTMIPGLIKQDGYTGLRRMITKRFKVKIGNIFSPSEDANYFEFPYDWRRTNVYNANKLKRFIDSQLHIFRKYSQIKDAKVILIGHSMGGLISRYYLEVLEGWRDCKALFTLGTPHRGAVNTLGFLSNGYTKFNFDFTEIMRSFNSVYELLPTYKCISINGNFKKVLELENIPNLSLKKAKKSDQFHREILNFVEKNRKKNEFLQNGYNVIPIVGTSQPTYQTAYFKGSKLELTDSPPNDLPSFLADGDGTVPRISAIPWELSSDSRNSFTPAIHASIQNDLNVQEYIYQSIKNMEVDLTPFRGGNGNKIANEITAISLNVKYIYQSGQPIIIKCNILNNRLNDLVLIAKITQLENRKLDIIPINEGKTKIESLSVGTYHIEVATSYQGPGSPSSVSDFFIIF